MCVKETLDLIVFFLPYETIKREKGRETSDQEQEKQWKAGLVQRIINWPMKQTAQLVTEC